MASSPPRPLAPSSPSPRHAIEAADSLRSEDNSTTSFTFVLNHHLSPSQAAAAADGSANPDRFAHTRTKRKRTSPEDFAILESAYERDPKPDRAARTIIASRVALNEKEVQIWFQNRRQMTRRKARTWQPNEISEIIRTSQPTGSASPPPSQELSSQDMSSSQSSIGDKNEDRSVSHLGAGLFEDASMKFFAAHPGQETVVKTSSDVDADSPVPMAQVVQVVSKAFEHAEKPIEDIAEESSNAAHVNIFTNAHDTLSNVGQKSTRSLKRAHSSMHMRVSLDGKAEMVYDKTTPSPPSKINRRESWPPRGGALTRSQSAVSPSVPSLHETATDVPSSSQPCQPWPLTHPAGHSRDTRAWSFYCDPDAPDTLAIAAEHDRKGNAQGALRLLRSQSAVNSNARVSPLAPNLRKQNVGLKRSIESAEMKTGDKRKSLDEVDTERPKFARTSSSMARLQSSASKANKLLSAAPTRVPKIAAKKSKKPKKGVEVYEDDVDDSDKENWEPGTRVSAPVHPLRPHNAPSRQILGTNLREMSHESSIGALLASRNIGNVRRRHKISQTAVQDEENAGAGDAEVASFMGENGTNDEQGEDMNAVQSLLSLSQGGRW